MSVLKEYLEAKRKQQEANDRLAKLESNNELMQVLEFQDKLTALMQEYNQKPQDVAAILGIGSVATPVVSSDKRKAERAMKLYINPNNGERVETKGGNHKVLNAWREQYGKEAVDSWLQA